MNESEVAGLVSAGEAKGLVTRADALKFLSAGQLQRRLNSGALICVFPLVYRVAGAPETWRQSVEALLLWAGRGAVLSHRTAAVLHGFEGFSEGPLELTSTRQLRVPPNANLYRVRALPHTDVTTIEDWAVTNATRTLIDLAASADLSTLHAAFNHALCQKKTTLEKLAKAVERSGNRPGIIEVRRLVGKFAGEGGPTENELETRAVTTVVDAGLPRPTVQWRVVVGRKMRRLDLIFTEQGVVVETDGYAWHAGIESFEDDRERNNSLTAGGFRVLHWTWQALNERPEELVEQLYAALNMRR